MKPTITSQELIAKLEQLMEKIHGCGNGRDMLDKFINQIKREYEIT